MSVAPELWGKKHDSFSEIDCYHIADHLYQVPTIYQIIFRNFMCAALVMVCACTKNNENSTESSGKDVREQDEGRERMVELLDAYAERAGTDHPILGAGDMHELRNKRELFIKELEQYSTSLEDESELLGMTMKLAKSELQMGNLDEGIQLMESAYARLKQVQKELSMPDRAPAIVAYDLGVAYMRRGETENCCASNAADNCILPIQGGGIHKRQGSSKKAIMYFTKVLDVAPPTSPYYLKSNWLLNVMYMTIGGYPDQVPESYRISPSTFKSDEDFPRFVNIASTLGVDVFDLLGGVVIDDFTGDGYLDIVVSTWDPRESVRFFRNTQDGGFSDETDAANLSGAIGGFNLIQADYDNDGDLDIYVMRGGWMGDRGNVPNSLLQNDGKGRFTDVTFAAGLGENHYPSQTASWADYNNDGQLDLYVGNEHKPNGRPAPCQLFRNNGDGTFTDMAEKAGVQNMAFAKSVAWGDYNADGFIDLYVSNFASANRLFRNNRDGTFTDVAEQLNVTGPLRSFPAWFWDFDNDGVLDLFVAGYDYFDGNLAAYVQSKLGLPGSHVHARLYRGDGKGGFKDVAQEQNLTKVTLPMGANFGDLDNDGYLDFYLGTGYPGYEALMPSVMYRNRGGQGFSDITTAGGFGHLQKGHGVAFADLDNDGDQDVYEQMGGFYRGDKSFNSLFENPGFDHRWITLKLVGKESNRSAIGARIHIEVIENGKPRSIYKHVNSGGSFGANPLRQTIGLGKASKIKRLVIDWPATWKKQIFLELEMDQFIEVVEGQDEYRPLDLKRLRMASE